MTTRGFGLWKVDDDDDDAEDDGMQRIHGVCTTNESNLVPGTRMGV
jgi:hypothetical protein